MTEIKRNKIRNSLRLPGKIIGITPDFVSDELLLNADIDGNELFTAEVGK